MNKTFAIYLTTLIAKDLESRHKDLPSYIYEIIENYFIGGQFNKIEEFLNSYLEKSNDNKVLNGSYDES